MSRKSSLRMLLFSALVSVSIAGYTLIDDYSGPQFFSKFDFFTEKDPTNGHVKFANLAASNASGLAGMISGGPANGSVYLGVDFDQKSPAGRAGLRLISKNTYNHSMVIVDVAHMPTGCGTWPAFWLLGTGAAWPQVGEVDIVEQVNEATVNRMTLHTTAGVSLSNNSALMKGQVLTSDCDVNAPNQGKNQGCAIDAPAELPSFGQPFNDNHGGVFATEVAGKGVWIWFFPRGSIPADLSTGNPNPSMNWGKPTALFTNNEQQVDWDGHFRNLQIIFDTTFCGDWAGAPSVWQSSSCASKAATCEDFVSNNPGAYKDAYWAVNSLKVYRNDDGGTPARY